jgi:hypothetical protein
MAQDTGVVIEHLHEDVSPDPAQPLAVGQHRGRAPRRLVRRSERPRFHIFSGSRHRHHMASAGQDRRRPPSDRGHAVAGWCLVPVWFGRSALPNHHHGSWSVGCRAGGPESRQIRRRRRAEPDAGYFVPIYGNALELSGGCRGPEPPRLTGLPGMPDCGPRLTWKLCTPWYFRTCYACFLST